MKVRFITLGLVVFSFVTPGHATTISDASASTESDNYYYLSEVQAYNHDDVIPGSGLSVYSGYPSGGYLGAPVGIESSSAYISAQSSYDYSSEFGYNSDPYYYSSASSNTEYGFDVYVTPLSDFYFDEIPITLSYTSVINIDGNDLQGMVEYVDDNGEITTTVSGKDSSASAFTWLEVTQDAYDEEGLYENQLYLNYDSYFATDIYHSETGSQSMYVDIYEGIMIEMVTATDTYGNTSSGWTTAGAKISDVTVNIDPTWEYASLFEVNYEYVEWPSITSPVPEPSTLALMLAGFGLIGFKSHRRNKLSA